MTKNRDHKQKIRAEQAAGGGTFMAARRRLETAGRQPERFDKNAAAVAMLAHETGVVIVHGGDAEGRQATAAYAADFAFERFRSGRCRVLRVTESALPEEDPRLGLPMIPRSWPDALGDRHDNYLATCDEHYVLAVDSPPHPSEDLVPVLERHLVVLVVDEDEPEGGWVEVVQRRLDQGAGGTFDPALLRGALVAPRFHAPPLAEIMVGNEDPLHHAAWKGRQKIVLVSGKPGTGKTQAARDLVFHLTAGGRQWIEVICDQRFGAWEGIDYITRTVITPERERRSWANDFIDIDHRVVVFDGMHDAEWDAALRHALVRMWRDTVTVCVLDAASKAAAEERFAAAFDSPASREAALAALMIHTHLGDDEPADAPSSAAPA